MALKDLILDTLAKEEANHAHKIRVKKQVKVKKQFPIKKEQPRTIKIVTKKLEPVTIKTPFTKTIHEEKVIPATDTEPEKRVATSHEDVDYKDVEHMVWKDVVEEREVSELVDSTEEREVLEEIEEEIDGPAFFTKPQTEIANDIHKKLLQLLKLEIAKPEYAGLTDEQIVEKLNGPFHAVIVSQVTFAPATKRIIAQANDQWHLHVKHGGNITEAIDAAIDEEIKTDPENRGYATCKTREEQLALMEKSFTVNKEEKQEQGSVWQILTLGISYAPNAVTIEDIKDVKKA